MIRHCATLATMFALSACEAGPGQPQVGVGLGIGPNGVRLVPRISTNVGGVNVGATPGGVGVGTNVGGIGVGARL